MSAQNFLPALPDPAAIPIPARIAALIGEGSQLHSLLLQSLFLRAARGEHLALLVGDNRFDAYHLARLARAHGFDPTVVLSRIALTRAFTCYQLHQAIVTIGSRRRAGWDALYISGLLELFYDQDLREHEARRLVVSALTHLKQIAAGGLPILVTLSRAREHGREAFIEMTKSAVDAYWEPSPLVLARPAARQLELIHIPTNG